MFLYKNKTHVANCCTCKLKLTPAIQLLINLRYLSQKSRKSTMISLSCVTTYCADRRPNQISQVFGINCFKLEEFKQGDPSDLLFSSKALRSCIKARKSRSTDLLTSYIGTWITSERLKLALKTLWSLGLASEEAKISRACKGKRKSHLLAVSHLPFTTSSNLSESIFGVVLDETHCVVICWVVILFSASCRSWKYWYAQTWNTTKVNKTKN